jgi:hypothetical protein
LVLLEAHPRTTAVPQTSPSQLASHILDDDRKACGKTLDDDDETATM